MKTDDVYCEPSGVRLMRLIDEHLPEIVQRESRSEGRIRLYGTGDYWNAFEQSAYLLWQLFPDSELTSVRHRGFPFPVVIASISDIVLQSRVGQNVFLHCRPDYREMFASDVPVRQYASWHRQTVDALTFNW